MQTSTGPAEPMEPVRHIDWSRLIDERAVLDHVWAALAAEPTQCDRGHVLNFLQREGLRPGDAEDGGTIFAYADGPRESGSPVECEWYLEFRFEQAGDRLRELAAEKRQVGP